VPWITAWMPAADLNAFALALGLSKYAFVGHSMGGRIAIRAASHHPIGLTRVVAVDPPSQARVVEHIQPIYLGTSTQSAWHAKESA
jgi:pimeloyl-ACP methyl ester carboxylesterase